MMSTQEQLIAALKEKFPNESQAGLARKAGLSVQRFNNYCTGIRTMDVDAVIGCAQAVGWDIRATVAQHEIEVAPTPRVKAMWQKLAGASLIALCAIGLSGFPAESKAYGFEPQRECILCNPKAAGSRWRYYWYLIKVVLGRIMAGPLKMRLAT